MLTIDDQGIDDLAKLLSGYADLASRPVDILEPAAEAFVKDLLALPRPRSNINTAGRTHMVDAFTYAKENDKILAGWGVPYGPYVEHGQHPHKRMKAQPHFKRTWKANESKYVRIVQTKLFK